MAFTLMFSFFNSCANAMVYELAAALLVLYATTCNMASGFDWIVFDAMSIETFTMTAFSPFRTRGSKVLVVWMRPKKLVSNVARTVEREIVVAFWSSSNLAIPDVFWSNQLVNWKVDKREKIVPALFTSTSNFPSFLSIVSFAAWIVARSVTSIRINSTFLSPSSWSFFLIGNHQCSVDRLR